MAAKCDYSTLKIPNDRRFAAAAAAFVRESARIIGFDEKDLAAIEQSVSRAICADIDYSFEAGENEHLQISCERIPAGIKITLKDEGLPLDQPIDVRNQAVSVDPAKSSLGMQIFPLKEVMNEVTLHNLGPEGKEIVLIKHLEDKDLSDYYAACELEPTASPAAGAHAKKIKHPCRVRMMRPAEASDISKSIYKSYGYTYPHEFVYYPEKLIAWNEDGRIHSAVAIGENDQVVGHCALQSWEENPQIAEMGQGVVRPEFRSGGCFARLTEYLIQHAISRKYLGIFGLPVTAHPFSQKTGAKSGLRDCALLLGSVPETATFKNIAENLSQRVSMLLQFRFLRPRPETVIYPPANHLQIIQQIYANLDTAVKVRLPGAKQKEPRPQASSFKIQVFSNLNTARIFIERVGADLHHEIRIKLRELLVRKILVVNLYLNLCDPQAFGCTRELEKLGFFFAGLMPAALPRGDAIILQYLNNVPIDYRQIQLASGFGRKILAHVRNNDPNVIKDA